jgi:hypothetical protein
MEHVVIFACMYINAVADSVVLYLQHDFYNTIFKIKHKLYIASASEPPPLPPPPHQEKILGAHLSETTSSFHILSNML